MKTILSSAVALALVGCAVPQVQKKEAGVEQLRLEAAQHMQTLRTPSTSPVSTSSASYIPLRKLPPSAHSAAQRQVLAQEIATNRPFSHLGEVATWLSALTHLPVNIHPELMGSSAGSGAAAANPTAPPAGGRAAGAAAGGSESGLAALTAKPMQMSYSGTVSGFLDMVAANYGIFWKLDDAGLLLFLSESRTFRIKTLPGDTQLSSTVGGAGSGGSSAGAAGGSGGASGGGGATSGGNSTGVSISNLSVWGGIESSIRQLLSPGSGKLAVSPSTGTVTVTDTPRVLARVADLIQEQNASLARQVAIHVRVLSVTVDDGADYGINWDAVYNSLSVNRGFSLKTSFPVAEGVAAFTLGASSRVNSGWGSTAGAIISALSTQGKVSELTSASMVTLNNQPAPVQVGRQISYLASSSTTLSGNAGAMTTLQPGQVNTGFSMVVLPHVMDGKELLLQSSINISSLVALKSNSSGSMTIQSPDVATSNFIQRVRMQSGDTLVLAGFDQDNLSAVSSGVGDAKNLLMGSTSGKSKRTMLVILVQPAIAS